MEGKDFTEWRERMGFNRTQAAEALGLGRNMPQRYEDGETEIPKYVELACLALANMPGRPLPEGLVEVYSAWVYNAVTDIVTETPTKRTRAAIASIGGEVNEESKELVRTTDLDQYGRYDPRVRHPL